MYLHKVKLHLHLGPSASLKFQLWTFNYHIIITSPWHCAVWECKLKSCFREITIRRGVWVHSSTKDPKTGSWAKLKGWDHCNKSFGNSLLDISNLKRWLRYSVQFIQALSRLWLCDPMNRSTPGLPVHHQLPEITQTHVHRLADAIQPSHPLSSPSSPTRNPSQHQGLFQWLNSLHEVATVLEFQL